MRFNNLQILRTLAALGVFAHHLRHYARERFHASADWADALPLAQLASACVAALFAVSGFVLTRAARTAPPGRFLLARLIRLYPGYWLALLAATLLLAADGVPREAFRLVRQGITAEEVLLLPPGSAPRLYLLGVEWTQFYEVTLSLALALFALLGPRRAVPLFAAGWLVVLGAKAVLWPDFAFEQIPSWRAIFLSAINAPFLLGSLVASLPPPTRRGLIVLGVTLAALAFLPPNLTGERCWLAWSVVAAGVVWLAVGLPQADAANVAVRLGDCTYGLYLLHVPLLLAAFRQLSARGWLVGQPAGVLLAASVALVGAVAFGRLEVALHARLRAKLTPRRPVDLKRAA